MTVTEDLRFFNCLLEDEAVHTCSQKPLGFIGPLQSGAFFPCTMNIKFEKLNNEAEAQSRAKRTHKREKRNFMVAKYIGTDGSVYGRLNVIDRETRSLVVFMERVTIDRREIL